ncbi:unnamed protein product [Linum tenue]|uniref:Reverse transcriptase zinc-binding domain-containing protein n=1 Tax=Linum tenue TaxID=586396 RepID=A0AAV0PU11_9ROSI|nr:unnamed protein product [Linum tenue]
MRWPGPLLKSLYGEETKLINSSGPIEACRVWLERESEVMGLNAFGDRETWKSIWAMKVPPNVMQFMWHFMRDALPTGDHVSTRSKKWSDRCLFSAMLKKLKSDGDCFEWTRQVMQQMRKNVVEEWCNLLWFLWKERNSQLFNGHKKSEDKIVVRAHYFLIDYKEHQLSEEAIREMGEGQFEKKWKRPCQEALAAEMGVQFAR